MSRFTFSAIALLYFGTLAANTYYRFNETGVRSQALDVLQSMIDFSLTSWLGNTFTALVLASLAVVVLFRALKRSYEIFVDAALKTAPATVSGRLYQPIEQTRVAAAPSVSSEIIVSFFHKIRSLGWIILLAGSIPAVFTGYDYATGTVTNATVVGLEMKCWVKRCEKCTTRLLSCAQVDQDPDGTYFSIDRTPYAKVRFRTDGGEVIETKAAFTKLGLKDLVSTGQSFRMRYNAANPTSVSSEKLNNGFGMGIGFMLCGIVLIVVNRQVRTRFGQ